MNEGAVRHQADGLFNSIILTAFILVAGLGALHHDLWRDEMQAFLIARDSATPWDLVRNLRYDGHPILWYLLIWPTAQLSRNPDAIKLTSLAVTTAGLGIFLWQGPWTRLEKILWPFGYYILFECTIKSRSYGLGVMLLAAFCACWRTRRQHMPLIALVLGLMANTHILFASLAASAAAALMVDRVWQEGWRGLFVQFWSDLRAVSIFIILVGFAFFVAAPASSGDFARLPFGSQANFGRVLVALGQFVLPLIGVFLSQSASSNTIAFDLMRFGIPLSFLAFLLSLAVNLQYPAAATMQLLGVGSTLGVFYFIYGGLPQHAGVVLVAIVVGQWIARESPVRRSAENPTTAERIWRIGFPLILGSHAVTGLAVVAMHTWAPYSNGFATAEYIQRQGWAAQPVAGMTDSFTAVCGYLRVRACYYADRDKWSSYFVYDGAPIGETQENTDSQASFSRTVEAADKIGPHVTLVIPTDIPIHAAILPRHGFHRVAAFTNAEEDNYIIYRKGN